jgi:hypothetical protein
MNGAMVETTGFDSPALALAALGALLVSGLVVLASGRRSSRWGLWLVVAVLAACLGVLIDQWSLLAQKAFAPAVWSRGWILPREDAIALRVGVLRDPLGVLMAVASILAGGFAAGLVRPFLRPSGEAKGREDRLVAAIATSSGSAAIAWLAETPWLALIAWAGTAAGGFFMLTAKEGSDREAGLAWRFAWERASGTLLAALGLGVLSLQSRPESGLATRAFGEALVFCGLLGQLHLFPFSGGLPRASDASAFFTTALTQIIPAWAAAALLTRFLPELSGTPALSL